MVYNFFKKEELKHNLSAYKKYGIKKKYYSPVSALDFKGIEGEVNELDQFSSKDILPNKETFNKLPDSWQQSLLNWSDNGYAVLDRFISEDQVDAINADLQRLIDNKTVSYRYGNKIMFALHHSDIIKDTGNNRKIKDILEMLLGREIDLFQSINFNTGSKQKTHSDAVHMTTFPEGNMIAVWIALEDIKKGSGELHYYPGSHRLPYIMNHDYGNIGSKWKVGSKDYHAYEDYLESFIEKQNLEKEVFLAKKGDMLIWHANILHGGEPVTDDQLTRKSMVFHYYAKDVVCYHEFTQRPTLKKKL